jgi:hypothetical protein
MLELKKIEMKVDIADIVKNITRVKGGFQVKLTLTARVALAIIPDTPDIENGAIITITRETLGSKQSALHLVSSGINTFYGKEKGPLNIYLNNNWYTNDIAGEKGYYLFDKKKK